MVRSLALVFAFVLAVLALDPRPEGNGLRTVDWSQSVPQAVAAANYPIAVPVGLEPGWRTTSARVTQTPDGSAAWHIGFVTPQEEYAGVEQSDGDVDAFVKDMTRQARRVIYDGAGGNWVSLQRTIGAETRRSLVLWPEPGGTYGKSVVIVTGTASWDELRQLAEAVRPR